MAKQSNVSKGRPLLLGTAAIAGAPDNGYESPQDATPLQEPHHRMSPLTPTLMRTSGIIIGLNQPSAGPAVANAGGFELILWVANPSGYFWQRSTSVFLDYRDASVTYDIDAFPIYLQIDPTSVAADGDILFSIMEQ